MEIFARKRKKTDYQKYQDTRKLQIEGMNHLKNAGVNEALDRTVKGLSKGKDVVLGIGKVGYGSSKRLYLKGKPSPIPNIDIREFETRKKNYAKERDMPLKYVIFDKRKGTFRPDNRFKNEKHSKGVTVKIWRIKRKVKSLIFS